MLRQKREKNGTGICHVMQGKESKTCPSDSSVGTWILLFLLCLPTNPNSEYSDTFFDSLDEK